MEIVKEGQILGVLDNDTDDALSYTMSRLTLSAEDAAERGLACLCVSNHNPNPQELHWHHIWPLGDGGPDSKENLVLLCPNTHANIHVLLREYKRHAGRPPYEVRKHYSAFAQSYAALAWKQIEESKVTTT